MVMEISINGTPDIDGDGIPNRADPDMDGDGIPNRADPDMDGDGIPNRLDLDGRENAMLSRNVEFGVPVARRSPFTDIIRSFPEEVPRYEGDTSRESDERLVLDGADDSGSGRRPVPEHVDGYSRSPRSGVDVSNRNRSIFEQIPREQGWTAAESVGDSLIRSTGEWSGASGRPVSEDPPAEAPMTPEVSRIPETSRIPTTETLRIPETSRIPTTETLRIPETSRIPTTETLRIPETSRIPTTETLRIPETSRIPTTETSRIPTAETLRIPTTDIPKIPKIPTTPGTGITPIPTSRNTPTPRDATQWRTTLEEAR